MRDINRIDTILQQLGEIWKMNPDLRLGQLLLNCMAGLLKNINNIKKPTFFTMLVLLYYYVILLVNLHLGNLEQP